MRESAARPARHRRSTLRTVTAAAAAAALLPVLSTAASANAAPPATTSLQQAFSDAAQRYRVPASVLLGVSYLESRWDTHQGLPSVTAGYGPMHLTDARTALAAFPRGGDGGNDPRGDDSRPLTTTAHAVPDADLSKLPATLTTLERAAGLTGLPSQELRQDAAANVAGGAALIADTQKSLGQPLSSDPADWYGAVARFSGADDSATAAAFADDVYDVLRQGQTRTTDDGQNVILAAAPGLVPAAARTAALGLKHLDDSGTECPRTVGCEWLPAPYQETAPGDYGNHDLADRPATQKIDTIVIHDTEGSWDTALKLVQDPTYLAWHYTVRSADGHIAQHLNTKDVGWHAGNWYINAKSIGIEHEGFLTEPGTWYTESMYRTSARLVAHLAKKYGIPLNRQHILGHDNVPGPTGAYIGGMHTDPGPYWDWAHYFQLMGAPLHATAGPAGGLVTIRPDYDRNRPLYTGCVTAGDTCPSLGSEAVRLHTAPSEDAPLVKDIGLHPTGDSTTGVNDVGARASTGQQYAVAERQGDWTAVWYLGQKAWFSNPRSQPTAVNAWGFTVTPKAGLADIPVYGRAYPEAAAFPAGVPVQAIVPLPYKLLAGQEYAIGNRVQGEYYYSTTFDPASHQVVRGKQVYYEIQFGHRVEYVKAEDVTVLPSQVGAPR
ncbi:N-acetylmuramoyl-L-alanine amidase [Streptomyces sp. H39-S7]|uniref:N-acetylmuramoyl-L-alanine amidase n=1 Tax=Streptomyces sp. H39-S7 TaxID=3004357 RepID=UPI003FA6BD7A